MKDNNNSGRWSDSDKKFLKENYYKLSIEEIMNFLKRSKSSIRNAANKFNIIKERRIWTNDDDVNLLRLLKDKKTYLEISKIINRSVSFLYYRCAKINCFPHKEDTIEYRIRRIYSGMKSRCYNSKLQSYKNYGGRGIKICKEWLDDPRSFYNWAIKNGYQEHLTIDRINNDGDYSPDNCRWATRIQQANNQRSNILLTAFNETKTLKSWSEDERCSVSAYILYQRISLGWPPEKIITDNKNNKEKYFISAFGETKSAMEWAKDKRCKVSHSVLIYRLVRGVDAEYCITFPGRINLKTYHENKLCG